jgi:hypothetical protein
MTGYKGGLLAAYTAAYSTRSERIRPSHEWARSPFSGTVDAYMDTKEKRATVDAP